jgi:acetolactate synthase-1/2/3 large subunit
MKVTAYIAEFLKSRGIHTVFQLQGGMITRIVDELHRDGSFEIVSMHHEQACALAADGYARVTNKPGVAFATSGPGATNLITGIGNCYFDSIPALFITGQVNLNEQKGDRPIRQLGFQETDIVSVVKPITKAAYAVKSADEIPKLLREAYDLSLSGRPGPVLIDIPMNLQNTECEEFHKSDAALLQNPIDIESVSIYIDKLQRAIAGSSRPLILVGRGIRNANVVSDFIQFVENTGIPVVTSLNGLDIMPYDHTQRIGFIGSYGNRWANYALGTCDLLIVLGSRLDLRQTGADIQTFITGKSIFHVDIESAELNNRIKNCEILHSDLQSFFDILLSNKFEYKSYNDWYTEINAKREELPDTEELKKIKGINPNSFIHRLSGKSKQAKAFTTDVGSNQMWTAQSVEVSRDQLFLTSGGMGAMGYSLPAAIGACFALNRQPVVCINGDGGFQINIQELETIRRNRLPIKIIILNNHCLGMIRQFQDSYFDSQYAATVWGYSAPDFVAVANAYSIKADRINNEEEIDNKLADLWKSKDEPFLLDIVIDIHTNVFPKMLFGKPLTELEGEPE